MQAREVEVFSKVQANRNYKLAIPRLNPRQYACMSDEKDAMSTILR